LHCLHFWHFCYIHIFLVGSKAADLYVITIQPLNVTKDLLISVFGTLVGASELAILTFVALAVNPDYFLHFIRDTLSKLQLKRNAIFH